MVCNVLIFELTGQCMSAKQDCKVRNPMLQECKVVPSRPTRFRIQCHKHASLITSLILYCDYSALLLNYGSDTTGCPGQLSNEILLKFISK